MTTQRLKLVCTVIITIAYMVHTPANADILARWAGNVVSSSGVANPQEALGVPDAAFANLDATPSSAEYNQFGYTSSLYDESAFAALLGTSVSTVVLSDFFAVEPNGGIHQFESSTWIFDDGVNSLTITYDINGSLPPEIAARDLISVANYDTFFSTASSNSIGTYAYLLFTLPGIDTTASSFSVHVQADAANDFRSPDPDSIAVIHIPQPSSDILTTAAKATYLQPNNPLDNPSTVDDARILDLANGLPFGIMPGDYIRLQAVGEFDFAIGDDNTGGPFGNGTIGDVWGVFSADGILQDVNLEDEPLQPRVLASVPVVVGDAAPVLADSRGIIPDQPNDFIINSEFGSDPDGVVVKVPDGATHLFLGAADEVWFDNTDDDMNYGVRITRIYEGRLVGDYNFDGIVDAADFKVWRDNFGASGIDPAGDGDLDGNVDGSDFLIWQRGYGTVVGQTPTSLQAVPEPTGLSLLLLGSCLARWRTRGRSFEGLSKNLYLSLLIPNHLR